MIVYLGDKNTFLSEFQFDLCSSTGYTMRPHEAAKRITSLELCHHSSRPILTYLEKMG